MAEHDKDCPGCDTDREMRTNGGAPVRDYLARCDACGGYIQGDTEHRAGGKDYHRQCLPTEQPVEVK